MAKHTNLSGKGAPPRALIPIPDKSLLSAGEPNRALEPLRSDEGLDEGLVLCAAHYLVAGELRHAWRYVWEKHLFEALVGNQSTAVGKQKLNRMRQSILKHMNDFPGEGRRVRQKIQALIDLLPEKIDDDDRDLQENIAQAAAGVKHELQRLAERTACPSILLRFWKRVASRRGVLGGVKFSKEVLAAAGRVVTPSITMLSDRIAEEMRVPAKVREAFRYFQLPIWTSAETATEQAERLRRLRRQLAKENHPDGGAPSDEEMKVINAHYETIMAWVRSLEAGHSQPPVPGGEPMSATAA